MLKIHNAYFLIESGPMQAAFLEHYDAVQANHRLNCDISKEFGARGFTTGFDDRLAGFAFNGDAPAGFTKPNAKGVCRPKKGSPWEKRLKEFKLGLIKTAEERIGEVWNVPCRISYTTADGEGSRYIGNFIHPAGFLWMGRDKPACLYVTDVPRYVLEMEAEGLTVDPQIKEFKLEFAGCKRITSDEWELMTLQDKVASQKARAKECAA